MLDSINKHNVFAFILLGKKSVLLGQSTNAVVRLAHHPDGSANGVHLGCAGHAASVGVNVDEVKLHGSMILGVDDAVAGGAGR